MAEDDTRNGRGSARPPRAVDGPWDARMRAARAGDDAAYRDLLTAMAPVLRHAAAAALRRAGQGNGEVEDIVQETLLAIHLKRHTWDGAQPLAPWVHAILRHKVIDVLRRRGRRAEVPVDPFIETLPDAQADPDAAGDTTRLLARLEPRARAIVTALALEDRPVPAVAKDLNMSEGALRVALHRALKKLAALSAASTRHEDEP